MHSSSAYTGQVVSSFNSGLGDPAARSSSRNSLQTAPELGEHLRTKVGLAEEASEVLVSAPSSCGHRAAETNGRCRSVSVHRGADCENKQDRAHRQGYSVCVKCCFYHHHLQPCGQDTAPPSPRKVKVESRPARRRWANQYSRGWLERESCAERPAVPRMQNVQVRFVLLSSCSTYFVSSFDHAQCALDLPWVMLYVVFFISLAK